MVNLVKGTGAPEPSEPAEGQGVPLAKGISFRKQAGPVTDPASPLMPPPVAAEAPTQRLPVPDRMTPTSPAAGPMPGPWPPAEAGRASIPPTGPAPGDGWPLPPAVNKPASRRLLVPIAVIVAVLALITVVLAVQLNSGHSGPAAVASSASAGPSLTLSSTDTSVVSTDTTAPISSPPTTPAMPGITAAGIDIGAVRSDPHIAAVADLFDRYLTATDAHDGSDLVDIFDPAGVIRSDTADGVATWESEVSTTSDDQMRLTAIRPNPQVPGGLLVHAAFRSQQDPSLGPDGQSCTNWDLVFRLTPYGGGYRVFGAQQVHAVAC